MTWLRALAQPGAGPDDAGRIARPTTARPRRSTIASTGGATAASGGASSPPLRRKRNCRTTCASTAPPSGRTARHTAEKGAANSCHRAIVWRSSRQNPCLDRWLRASGRLHPQPRKPRRHLFDQIAQSPHSLRHRSRPRPNPHRTRILSSQGLETHRDTLRQTRHQLRLSRRPRSRHHLVDLIESETRGSAPRAVARQVHSRRSF